MTEETKQLIEFLVQESYCESALLTPTPEHIISVLKVCDKIINLGLCSQEEMIETTETAAIKKETSNG